MAVISQPRTCTYIELELAKRLEAFQKANQGTDANAIVRTAMAYKRLKDSLSPPEAPACSRYGDKSTSSFPISFSDSFRPSSKKMTQPELARDPPHPVMTPIEPEIELPEKVFHTGVALASSLIALGVLTIACNRVDHSEVKQEPASLSLLYGLTSVCILLSASSLKKLFR